MRKVMYENDEMIPDILSVNMFLDRMGFGTLGVSAYISKKEAVYFQWRESTRECIQSEKYKNLSKLSECMPTKNMMLNEKIRQQYDWFLKGIIAEKEALDFESAKDYYEQALRCTCSCNRTTYLCHISEFVETDEAKGKKSDCMQTISINEICADTFCGRTTESKNISVTGLSLGKSYNGRKK